MIKTQLGKKSPVCCQSWNNDIPGRRAKNKLLFLNAMHKVNKHKDLELYVKNMLIVQHQFAMLDLKAADWIGN